jgi:hypothetical protein
MGSVKSKLSLLWSILPAEYAIPGVLLVAGMMVNSNYYIHYYGLVPRLLPFIKLARMRLPIFYMICAVQAIDMLGKVAI